MLAVVKNGLWLTTERVRVYPAIFLAIAGLSGIVWIALSDGLLDLNGKPLGTDFSNVWSAGALVLQGNAPAAYDPAQHYDQQKVTFDNKDVPFYGWHYPPLFLGLAALLALIPYGASLFIWMGLTLSFYLMTLWKIAQRHEVLLPALAFPAVFINLGHGHNGFLSAALFGAGLHLLNKRPWIAGILLGCLVYKPQFGILIPVALIASARWKPFVSASLTVIASCFLSLALFGPETWVAFLDSLSFTRNIVLEEGLTGWHKIQSIFAAIRNWGGTVETAYCIQFFAVAGLMVSLFWLWRGPADIALKCAALMTASLIATPYVLDYDMVILAPAMVWMACYGLRNGFLEYEKSLLAILWAIPLLARPITYATELPVGVLAVLTFYIFILRRARYEILHAPAIKGG